LFHFLLAIQGLGQFQEFRFDDDSIDEECAYGAFTLDGRFVFVTEKQFGNANQEFRGFRFELGRKRKESNDSGAGYSFKPNINKHSEKLSKTLKSKLEEVKH